MPFLTQHYILNIWLVFFLLVDKNIKNIKYAVTYFCVNEPLYLRLFKLHRGMKWIKFMFGPHRRTIGERPPLATLLKSCVGGGGKRWCREIIIDFDGNSNSTQRHVSSNKSLIKVRINTRSPDLRRQLGRQQNNQKLRVLERFHPLTERVDQAAPVVQFFSITITVLDDVRKKNTSRFGLCVSVSRTRA